MGRLTRTVSLPLVLAAAGIAIVLYQWVGNRPLWLDEEMIALNFRDRSFAGLAGRLWLDQSAPLGWLALERLVLLIFGASERALRAVPALFGMATVLAAYLIGRRWMTTAGAAIFVLLCSVGQWITFHAGELKPYSSDTFWALCLPALAVAAAGAGSSDARRRGLTAWAIAAAIGPWFGLGALLVLPACFVVLALTEQRSAEGVRRLAVPFAVVIASFGLQYLLSLRYTLASKGLQDYWRFAMAPDGAGVIESLRWLYTQLGPFAVKPGGTALAALFWISAALGAAFAPARRLGAMAGLIVLSGFALAVLRIMPMYERLSLWFVPALYLAIALFADRAVWFLRQQPLKASWMNSASALLIAAMVAPVCADTVERGVFDLRNGRSWTDNHNTDDRAGIAWLMQQRRPDDILLTTRHAQPAVWWYGGVALSESRGRRLRDGGRILIAGYYPDPRACRSREISRVLRGTERIQVYLGFPDTPPGFDDLLLYKLSELGRIAAVRHFAGGSRAAVIDPALPDGSNFFWDDAGKDTGEMLKGCIEVLSARSW